MTNTQDYPNIIRKRHTRYMTWEEQRQLRSRTRLEKNRARLQAIQKLESRYTGNPEKVSVTPAVKIIVVKRLPQEPEVIEDNTIRQEVLDLMDATKDSCITTLKNIGRYPQVSVIPKIHKTFWDRAREFLGF